MNNVSIPSNLARVPNALASRIMLGSMLGTNQSLMQLQMQMATGQQVNRASDDPIAASSITVLDDVIERREQRLTNFTRSEAILNNVDAALGDASDLLLEAKSIGLSQIGAASTAETRANQAQVIGSMLNSLVDIANRKHQQVHFFGGEQTDRPPFEELLGGIRYVGADGEMFTDTGLSHGIPVTLSGTRAFGATSARVQGERDLDPQLTLDTRLSDLNGAEGTGVSRTSINIDINGTDVEVDLTDAHRVEDVITAVQDAIQSVDPGAAVQIDPATGNRFEIIPSAGTTVTISDLGSDGAAADLGLVGAYSGPAGGTGEDVDPRLTMQTSVSALSGVTSPLGSIQLSNAGQTRTLDLSATETIEDIANAVAELDLGIRVEINETEDRLNFINELSGGSMSIGEVAGGSTATELGVRSLAGSTLLDDFNDGRGVGIVSGSVDPITGNPDPSRDLDFKVTLKDGRSFDVDLAGASTVDDVLTAINDAAGAAGITVPGEFDARLAEDGNGLELVDNTAGTTTTVEALNGSFAAEDLGILGSSDGATLTGEDRATVAVDGVFTHLKALHDALLADDSAGISLATEQLESDITRLAEARGEVGVHSQRMARAMTREEDMKLQDTTFRSQLQHLEYTEASLRFASLQQQLQASYLTAGRVGSLSLLDFLG